MKYITTFNPATGVELARLECADAAAIDAAVQRAQLAQREWAALTAAQRGRILRRAADLLRERPPGAPPPPPRIAFTSGKAPPPALARALAAYGF